jgi:hypothetical protein
MAALVRTPGNPPPDPARTAGSGDFQPPLNPPAGPRGTGPPGRGSRGRPRPGRRRALRRPDQGFQQVEGGDDLRVVPRQPAADGRPLLAERGDHRVAAGQGSFRLGHLGQVEERFALDQGQHRRAERRGLLVAEDGLGDVPRHQRLPDAQDGDRAGIPRHRLLLPGAGQLGLRGGQRFAVFLELLQEGGGEGVRRGRYTGADTIEMAWHGMVLRAELEVGGVVSSVGLVWL